MTTIVEVLKNNINNYLNMSPEGLKKLLLDTNATAQCISLNAHKSIDSLKVVGDTIRETASLLPSAGVALTMHNHILLVMQRFQNIFVNNNQVLSQVAKSEVLLASAFAEAIPGGNIFSPNVQLYKQGSNVIIHGSKKPCSLSSIADYYAISASDLSKPNDLQLVLVHSGENIKVKPFWKLSLLKDCDNQEVCFENAEVSNDFVSPYNGVALVLVLSYGLSLFNYFAANVYSGALDGLIQCISERVAGQSPVQYQIAQYSYKINTILGQMLFVANQAYEDDEAIHKVLGLRYLLEDLLETTASYALRCCGGIEVMTNSKVMEFFSIIQFFKFHPISEIQTLRQALAN